MPKAILMEEFHVTVFVPPWLTDLECAKIRRALDAVSFRNQLRRAVLGVFDKYRSLSRARVKVTR
jgi:hypothetical protein